MANEGQNLHAKITQLEATITQKDLEIEQLRIQVAQSASLLQEVISATTRIDACVASVGNI